MAKTVITFRFTDATLEQIAALGREGEDRTATTVRVIADAAKRGARAAARATKPVLGPA